MNFSQLYYVFDEKYCIFKEVMNVYISIQYYMRNATVIPFYLRKTRINSKGFAPICMRVAVNNRRIDLTTNRFVDPLKWSAASRNFMSTT